jgi:hypothetical protein
MIIFQLERYINLFVSPWQTQNNSGEKNKGKYIKYKIKN